MQSEITAPPQRRWPRVVTIALGLGFIALLVNWLYVNAQTRPAQARDGGQIIVTDIEAANVKVDGDGPPILLIHGFGAAIDWWDAITPTLAQRHRVIRLDLIGHGGTAAPTSGYGIPRQAELAAAVLDKLHVQRVTVIGHSMGGAVAVALTALRPQQVERLILIDSPPLAETDFTLLTRLYLTPLIGQALSHFRDDAVSRRGLAQGFAPGFAVPDKFVADLKQLTYPAFHQAHQQSIAYRAEKPTSERLAELAAPPPLLVIFGREDTLVSPAQAALFERVPRARIELLEGVGHSPMVEQPARTLALIEAFLQ